MFEFFKDLKPYSETPGSFKRLQQRHRLIVEPFAEQLQGARVLDLACHDGRWSYALAHAGAAEVIGIEAREALVARFANFPTDATKSKVQLYCADIFDALEERVAKHEHFDVVALYGIFYHVMDHQRLLTLIARLTPSVIIIDSEFINADNAMIQILMEKVDNPLNTTAKVPHKDISTVGVPSFRATEFMADAVGYDVMWLNAGLILGSKRQGMDDYFRTGRKVRATCALTPQQRS